MTACRSSIFLPVTRTCSSWMAACTFSLLSLIILTSLRALSLSIPSCSLISCLSWPRDVFSGSPNSMDLGSTLRLTKWEISMSRMARIFMSSPVTRDMVLDLRLNSISVTTPRKSYRVSTSLRTLFTALSTSCRSSSLTISNDGITPSFSSVYSFSKHSIETKKTVPSSFADRHLQRAGQSIFRDMSTGLCLFRYTQASPNKSD